MKFNPADLPSGVFFRRTSNGWHVTHKEDDSIQETVHQDDDYSDFPAAASLHDALVEHFDSYLQSKWTGGLSISAMPARSVIEAEEEKARLAAEAAASAPEPEPEPAPEPEPEPAPRKRKKNNG